MNTITIAKIFAWLVIPIFIVMYTEAMRDIKKFLVRDIPLFIALVIGVTIYIIVATKEASPIKINYPDGRVGYIVSPEKRDVPLYALLGEALVFVGVGLAVIYVIIHNIINERKRVEEQTDNIASDFDDAEAFLSVGCEEPLCTAPSEDDTVGDMIESEAEVFFNVECEKPLFSAPSDDNTACKMIGGESTIVVTYNIWWMIPCMPFLLPMVFEINALTILISGLGILLLFWSFNNQIIFDDDGITTKNKFFDNSKETTILSWSTISEVDYFSELGTMNSFFNFRGDGNSFVRIREPWHKNYEESLRYAVQKLPPGVFDVSARKRLSELCICHLDW